jgi:hypothetical protein
VVSPPGSSRHPERAIVDFLRAALRRPAGPDLVITTGGPAAAFAQKYRTRLFPGSPVLYAAVDQRFVKAGVFTDQGTAVAVANDPVGKACRDIRRLFPATENVFVVLGRGCSGRFWRTEFEREATCARAAHLADGLSYAAMLQRVPPTLPPRSAIFFQSFDVDTRRRHELSARVLADLRARTTVPIFGRRGAELWHTESSAATWSPSTSSAGSTADVALRIMAGTSPALIKIPMRQPGPRLFDWREVAAVRRQRGPSAPGQRRPLPGAWHLGPLQVG